MKKHSQIYTLFVILFFYTSCLQNKTNTAKENINAETKDSITSQVPNSMVRNIKQARNGDIYLYDGKTITDFRNKKGRQ